MLAGDKLDPPISWTIAALELEHSFGAMLLILSLLVWMAHWFAVGCVGIAMGTMVLKRKDGRHALTCWPGWPWSGSLQQG